MYAHLADVDALTGSSVEPYAETGGLRPVQIYPLPLPKGRAGGCLIITDNVLARDIIYALTESIRLTQTKRY